MNLPSDPHTPTTALQAQGWKENEDGGFVRGKGASLASLHLHSEHGDWRYFEVQGGKLPKSSNEQVLADNARLYGPLKLVARDGSAPFYRIDLHDATETSFGSRDVQTAAEVGRDGYLMWAEAITACVDGRGEAAADEADAARLAGEINQCGWQATVDEGSVHVHLTQPGVFRQVRVEQAATAGISLATDLATLNGYTDESLRAVTRMANVANDRLPLVRFAIQEQQSPLVLRAEVNFGRALIPGTWLSTALQALENAIAYTAREAEALRDPELAKLVLAAFTA